MTRRKSLPVWEESERDIDWIRSKIIKLGGPGSGHHGHSGRPGKRGGSAPSSRVYTAAEFGKMYDDFIFSMKNVEGDTWLELTNTDRGIIKDTIVSAIVDDTGVSYGDVNDVLRTWSHTANDHDLQALSMQEAISEEFGVPMSDWQKQRLADLRTINEAYEYRRRIAYEEEIIRTDLILSDQEKIEMIADYKKDFYEKYPNIENITAPKELIRFNYQSESTWRYDLDRSGISREQERAVVRSMYNQTQKFLGDAGVKPTDQVTLYRGFVTEQKVALGYLPTVQNAASSWSFDLEVAGEFSERFNSDGMGYVLSSKVPASSILSTALTGFGCSVEAEVTVLSNESPSEVVDSHALSELTVLGGPGSGHHGHKGLSEVTVKEFL